MSLEFCVLLIPPQWQDTEDTGSSSTVSGTPVEARLQDSVRAWRLRALSQRLGRDNLWKALISSKKLDPIFRPVKTVRERVSKHLSESHQPIGTLSFLQGKHIQLGSFAEAHNTGLPAVASLGIREESKRLYSVQINHVGCKTVDGTASDAFVRCLPLRPNLAR